MSKKTTTETVEKHVLVFNDGYTVSAELNGNNYITATSIPDEELSVENLSKLTIDGSKYENFTCDAHWIADGYMRFIIRPLTSQELKYSEIQSNINYIAMMAEIDL